MKNITLHLNSITLKVTAKEAKALEEVSISSNEKLKQAILDKIRLNLENGDAYESAEEE